MAVTKTYDVNPTGVGSGAIREDLTDVIYRISPEETPFMSNIGRESVSSTYHEWQTDALAAPDATNARAEGADATDTAYVNTHRVGNYTQISDKVINVSGTSFNVDAAGMRTLKAFRTAKAGKELRTDMETILLTSQAGSPGTGAAPTRKLASLPTWIVTNSVANGQTAPTMSGGAGSQSGYPNAGWTAAGTAAAFSEANLKTVVQSMFEAGSKPKIAMMSAANKVKFSAFSGIAQIRMNYQNEAAMAEIIGAADVYLSDFGKITAVPNALMKGNTNVFFINPEYAKVGFLRPFQSNELAKSGDYDRSQMLVEYTLVVSNEKAHGIVVNTN